MLNPMIFLTGLASMFAFGPAFLAYVAISVAASAAAGSFCSDKIKELDSEIRKQAKDLTGNEQPGDADSYAEFVKKTTKTLGPFVPVVTAITACMGVFFSLQTSSLRSGSYSCARPRLRPGFVAQGQFRY